MIKYYTDEQIEKLISVEDAFEWVSALIKTKKDSILPAKTSLKMDGHIFYNYMPCILPQYNVAGVKVVNRYPNNSPSLKSNIMIYDLTNGDIKAVMDANYITSLRTGAVAAHSMLLFAKNDYKTIALVGLGNVTKMAFKIFMAKCQKRQLEIKLYRYKDHAERFIQEFGYCKNCEFVICNTYEELMMDSDIIVSGITYAEKDFCDEKLYKHGCTIVPIHTLGFQNCDLTFDKVFGDDYDHIKGFKYFDKFKSFNEVCDVVNGKVKGRENDSDRILVYNIGIAIHDIYFANNFYNQINNIKQD